MFFKNIRKCRNNSNINKHNNNNSDNPLTSRRIDGGKNDPKLLTNSQQTWPRMWASTTSGSEHNLTPRVGSSCTMVSPSPAPSHFGSMACPMEAVMNNMSEPSPLRVMDCSGTTTVNIFALHPCAREVGGSTVVGYFILTRRKFGGKYNPLDFQW